ncbi:C-C motif chemokine 5 isoform X2 [Xenopus laevis]|uniref:C-C motif chemokine n=1 Tax=Xenopus laevis TaxID=8355 RepID=A0A8J1MD22_XENLA|nr:C-C motif chemokine 5 isoform X2 [Xenopus laevis]
MKAALITLTVFIFVAFYNEAESAPGGETKRRTEAFKRNIDEFSKPTQIGSDVVSCCFDYMKKPIPFKHMTDYFYTSSRCSKFAVVLVTRKNRKICANPEDEWVKNIINALEMPEATQKP